MYLDSDMVKWVTEQAYSLICMDLEIELGIDNYAAKFDSAIMLLLFKSLKSHTAVAIVSAIQ